MDNAASCAHCGTALRDAARFCDNCGTPLHTVPTTAEYKQVTMLFADVVRSMELASAVEPERLRDLMTAVFQRSATVVQRYGGTVDKFTGDGIMALFGAPIALEDHAFRACLAALDIQNEMQRLATEVRERDGVDLRLRIGLNSGEVIAGDLDSGHAGYTAIGVQVGMAQRMEAAAPSGGVMLSEPTARLVGHGVMLGEPEAVWIKGSDTAVTAFRLLGTGDPGRHRRHETTFVGRHWELATLTGILDRALVGSGATVGIVGDPGIGKSRMVSEMTDRAARGGAEVFSTYCEAHAADIPFHAVARLLRAVFGVIGADSEAARSRLRARLPGGPPEDLLLLDDMLGIADPAAIPLDIDADARRRRLTALINTASLARTTPTLYIIEDAHWIDEVSDSMLADFVAVIPQTPAMVITTYRPEYRGEFTRMPRSQTVYLGPLDQAHAQALTRELLGTDPTVSALAAQVADRAAGNPFFAEEIVRDLAERHVITGLRGEYVATADVSDITVPSTLYAAIAARVDRLDVTAKRTLAAAAAIGSRFSAELVARLVERTDLAALVDAELIDQVMFTPRAEYAFRHPMIRTVAYESQLKTTRAELHRQLATAIEQDRPEAADENAASIAEHLQAAGELAAAFNWHMRAAGWSQYRDIRAAQTSWQRARRVADDLPLEAPGRPAMRIAPRALLIGNGWRIGGNVAEADFGELRELTGAAGDKLSLAIGMAGMLPALTFHNRSRDAAELATECIALLESLGDPGLIVALSPGALQAKAEAGQAAETLRLAQRIIDLTGGDPTMGNLVVGSPLSVAQMYCGAAYMHVGNPLHRTYFDAGISTARDIDPTMFATATMYKYVTIMAGVYLPDDAALRDTEAALVVADRSADHFALAAARLAFGVVRTLRGGVDLTAGREQLAEAREMSCAQQFAMTGIDMADIAAAQFAVAEHNPDEAIALCRTVLDNLYAAGDHLWLGTATATYVEALVNTGGRANLTAAQTEVDRLAATPAEPGFAMNEIAILRSRTLLARARGDRGAFTELAARYRDRAAECGFAGHLAWAGRWR